MKTGSAIRDFTEGSISKQIVAFALPFMFANTLQILYSTVDMIIVGQAIGSAGISAVSTSSHIINLLSMFSLGFCTGGQIIISQLIGAGRRKDVRSAISTLTVIIACFAVLMMFIGLIFHRQILSILQTPDEAYGMAKDYLMICCIGIAFSFGYNLLSAVFRGMGDSFHPFIFIMTAAILNLVLDMLFVLVFRWGVPGAAIATVIGQAVSFLLALLYIAKHREELGFGEKGWSIFSTDFAASLVKLGVPFALQSCAINISTLFVNGLINSQGVAVSATYGVGTKIEDFMNQTTMGIGYAVASMVGQNLAAGKTQRIKSIMWYSWLFAGIMYVTYAIILYLFPKKVFSIFSTDPNVLELSRTFVSAFLWGLLAFIIARGTRGFLQGVGNAKLSLLFSILDAFVIRIIFSYFFGIYLDMGLYGIVLGYSLAIYGIAIPGFIYFLSGRWCKRRLSFEHS